MSYQKTDFQNTNYPVEKTPISSFESQFQHGNQNPAVSHIKNFSTASISQPN
jgi:hypothetical protein